MEVFLEYFKVFFVEVFLSCPFAENACQFYFSGEVM